MHIAGHKRQEPGTCEAHRAKRRKGVLRYLHGRISCQREVQMHDGELREGAQVRAEPVQGEKCNGNHGEVHRRGAEVMILRRSVN